MNYFGVYHSNYSRSAAGLCNSPCIAKGRMMLCASNAASENTELAMHCGRIRNRAELIRKLECPKHISGSELVLNAYRRWGKEYPQHIEGPVMSCVLDSNKDLMILCRDRMGEQPIFYSEGYDGRVAFSDHPDALLKTAYAEPLVDIEGLCELFGMGPARTPGKTPFQNIKTLEPGCMICCAEGKMEIHRYFALKSDRHEDTEADTIAQTRSLLEMAIEEIRVFRPAVMLSGGLDSTALTAMLCQKLDCVQTFSVDYAGSDQDFVANAYRPESDRAFVDLASKTFSTQHHRIVLEQAQLAEGLGSAVSARGFPGMADIDSSLMLLAAQVAPHSHYVVTGECADEVFGGYPWFNAAFPVRKDTFPWSGSIDLRESVLNAKTAKRLDLKEYVHNAWQEACRQTDVGLNPACEEDRLRQLQHICLRYFMPNLQERAQRMCECSSVEVFTPFCDERLVQYVYSVPWNIKCMNGTPKGLLRAAVRDLLPEPLLRRKKSPYPKTCSPIYTEIIRGLTMAMLTDREAPILEWIDADQVRRLAESSLNPAQTPWYGQLMAGPQMLAYLWQVNTWMRERNVTVSL